MTDFPDYQEPQATATAIGNTNLVGTGLAREAGGNLATHTALLNGTQIGALIGNVGKTVGQEIAALIASGSATGTPGGTPLLHGAVQVGILSNQVIAASGTFNMPNITFTKPGYLIRVVAQMSAGGAAAPSLECILSWTVAGTGSGVAQDQIWFVPCGGATSMRSNGYGPTRGDTLAITLVNGDAVDSVTVTVQVWETTQHMARDDWRSTGGVSSSNAGVAAGLAKANIIANESVNVPAGQSVGRNLPLYCGQVSVFINQNVAAGSQVQILPVGAFTGTGNISIANLDWTLAPHSLVGVPLPRCWCQIQATNNGAGAVFFNYSIIALEYAS